MPEIGWFARRAIKIQDGKLYINDQLIELPVDVQDKYYLSHNTQERYPTKYLENQTIVLKGDECFLIGDNTTASHDSRYWGPAKFDQIEGVVDILYLPKDKFRIFR